MEIMGLKLGLVQTGKTTKNQYVYSLSSKAVESWLFSAFS
jgi:hypothetical protein